MSSEMARYRSVFLVVLLVGVSKALSKASSRPGSVASRTSIELSAFSSPTSYIPKVSSCLTSSLATQRSSFHSVPLLKPTRKFGVEPRHDSSESEYSNDTCAECALHIDWTTIRAPEPSWITTWDMTIILNPTVTLYDDGTNSTTTETTSIFNNSIILSDLERTEAITIVDGMTFTWPTAYITFTQMGGTARNHATTVVNNGTIASGMSPTMSESTSCIPLTTTPISLPSGSLEGLLFPIPNGMEPLQAAHLFSSSALAQVESFTEVTLQLSLPASLRLSDCSLIPGTDHAAHSGPTDPISHTTVTTSTNVGPMQTVSSRYLFKGGHSSKTAQQTPPPVMGNNGYPISGIENGFTTSRSDGNGNEEGDGDDVSVHNQGHRTSDTTPGSDSHSEASRSESFGLGSLESAVSSSFASTSGTHVDDSTTVAPDAVLTAGGVIIDIDSGVTVVMGGKTTVLSGDTEFIAVGYFIATGFGISIGGFSSTTTRDSNSIQPTSESLIVATPSANSSLTTSWSNTSDTSSTSSRTVSTTGTRTSTINAPSIVNGAGILGAMTFKGSMKLFLLISTVIAFN